MKRTNLLNKMMLKARLKKHTIWFERERGSMPVFIAIFVTAFAGTVTVVINQHQHLDGLSTARETSFNAARAASQELDRDALYTTNEPALDPIAATLAAENIVADVPGASIQSLDVDGDGIEIVVAVQVEGIVSDRTFTGTGTATAIDQNS